MRLPVYTSLLEVRREIRAIQEWVLPQPIPLVPFLVFLVSGALVFELVHRLGLPFSLSWGWVYVLVPFGLAKLADRPTVEGKPLYRWALTQLSYPSQPRHFARLQPMREPLQARLRMEVWELTPIDRREATR